MSGHLVVTGFISELSKLAVELPPLGMRRDEAAILEVMKGLHQRVGGDDPLQALQAGRMKAVEEEVRRLPFLEWLSRALRTGEVSRAPSAAEIRPGMPAMEHVLSVAEPLTQEQMALRSTRANPSLLGQLKGIVGERRSARAALNAMIRR